VNPPTGGFWQKGGFQGQNIWSSGSNMAPFDKRVTNYEIIKTNFF
jgi:hypothetical protein